MTPRFYRFFFFFLVYHDNQSRFSFPNHSPKILRGLVQGMLGRYVTLLSFVILKEWSIIFSSALLRKLSFGVSKTWILNANTCFSFLIKNYPLFDWIEKIKCKYRFVWIWFMIPGRVYLGWKKPDKRRKFDARHNPFCLRLHSLHCWQKVISLFYHNKIKVLEFSQGNAA